MKKYEGKVQFVMKNAPRGNLDESNTKYTAALWATAAGEQNKYFEMSHKMFDNFSELRKNSDLPIQLAAELGLDTEQLKIDYLYERFINKRYILIILFIVFAFSWNPKTALSGDIGSFPIYRIPYKSIKMLL